MQPRRHRRLGNLPLDSTIPTLRANLPMGADSTVAKGRLEAAADSILLAAGMEDTTDTDEAYGVPLYGPYSQPVPFPDFLDVDAEQEHLFWQGMVQSNGNLSSQGGDVVPSAAKAEQARPSDTSKAKRVHAVARWAANPHSVYVDAHGQTRVLGDHLVVHPNGDMTDVTITPEDPIAARNRINGAHNRLVERTRKCGHTTSQGYVKGCDTCYAYERNAKSRAKRAAREAANQRQKDYQAAIVEQRSIEAKGLKF